MDALLAIDEFHFSFGGIATFEDGAIVLRAEVLLEMLASALAINNDEDGGKYEHRNNDHDREQGVLVHGHPLSASVMPRGRGRVVDGMKAAWAGQERVSGDWKMGAGATVRGANASPREGVRISTNRGLANQDDNQEDNQEDQEARVTKRWFFL